MIIFSNSQVYSAEEKERKPLTDKYGAIYYVISIVPQTKFLSEPNFFSPTLDDPPGYLETLAVYNITKNKDFYYVRNNKNGCYGWISRTDLLTDNTCLSHSDKKKCGHLKIIPLHNQNFCRIPVYKGPGKQFKQTNQIQVFSIKYVFKIRKDFIFIGDTPFFNIQEPELSLSGWIEKKNCRFWSNRTGVYFNKSFLNKEHSYVFSSELDLIKYLNDHKKNNAIANKNNERFGLPNGNFCFPVLKSKFYENHQLIEIAFAGSIPQYNNMTNRNTVRQTLQNLMPDEPKHKDILFIIDATKSIHHCYQSIKNAVFSFIKKNRGKMDSRYSLAVYRDYIDYPKTFELLSPLDYPEKTFLIDKIEYIKSKDEDYPEAVYNAIIKGVSKVKWRNGIRSVILIGDHANHLNDHHCSFEQAITALKQNNISFFSIGIKTNNWVRRYTNLFCKQMNEIVNHIGGKGKNFRLDEFDITKKNPKLERIITNVLTIIHSDSTSLSNNISKTMNRLQYPSDLFGYENKYNYQKKCISSTGWFSFNSIQGLSQLNFFILMSRMELDELYGFMAGLYLNIHREPQRIKNAIENLIRRYGEDIQTESLSLYLRQKFDIPLSRISKHYQYSLTQLQNKFIKDKIFRKNFIKKIGEKYERLRFIIESKTGEIEFNNGKWRRTKESEKKWGFETKCGERYVWVPMHFLP